MKETSVVGSVILCLLSDLMGTRGNLAVWFIPRALCLCHLGFMPFGLHAIWTWSGSLLVPAEEREYICCLGLMPFGPCKGHLQYQLAWDNVSAIWTSCHLDLGKVIWCWRAYQLGWEVISLPGDQQMDWWARECLCHWSFKPFGPRKGHL